MHKSPQPGARNPQGRLGKQHGDWNPHRNLNSSVRTSYNRFTHDWTPTIEDSGKVRVSEAFIYETFLLVKHLKHLRQSLPAVADQSRPSPGGKGSIWGFRLLPCLQFYSQKWPYSTVLFPENNWPLLLSINHRQIQPTESRVARSECNWSCLLGKIRSIEWTGKKSGLPCILTHRNVYLAQR